MSYKSNVKNICSNENGLLKYELIPCDSFYELEIKAFL